MLIKLICRPIVVSLFLLIPQGPFAKEHPNIIPDTLTQLSSPSDSSLVVHKKITKNSILAAVGIRVQAIRDPLLSVMTYTGTAPEYCLQWSYSGKKFLHWGRVGFSQGDLTSSITAPNKSDPKKNYETFIGGNLGYGLTRFIHNWNNLRLYCGGTWDTYGFYKTHNYNPTLYQNYSIDFFTTLGPALFTTVALYKRHTLSIRFSFPIADYVIGRTYVATMSPDGLDDDYSFGSVIKSGDWLTLDKFVEIYTGFEYRVAIIDAVSLVGEYDFRYYNYSKLPRVKSTINTFYLGAMVFF